MASNPVLWHPKPAAAAASQMGAFLAAARARHRVDLADYAALHRWSVTEPEAFWGEVWDHVGMVATRGPDRVLDGTGGISGARWFPGARLNVVSTLLRHTGSREAVVFRGEDGRSRTVWSFDELRARVAAAAALFRALGVAPGDRVAGLMPNLPDAIAAMLGAAAVGAVWSGCSPDFGVQGVLDRFGQIAPKVLITTAGYHYKGRWVDNSAKAAELLAALPSVERLFVAEFPGCETAGALVKRLGADRAAVWDGALAAHADAALTVEELPFDHPLLIMYSSGTTGMPKGIVQGPGVILNHLKEHRLHCDLGPEDRIFYFTTTSWMMWNWLLSALGTGATVVLYDGSPFHPGPEALWRMAAEERLTVFGTSAKYIGAVAESGLKPRAAADLSALRLILSTGSPLAPELFDFVYRDVKPDVQLASISGGTDLNGCFALGNPLLPVRRGELQCRGLGMAVEVWDDLGRPVSGQPGELVCTRPFPSMPLGFWNDPDGSRYRASYFSRFPGVWHHGDYVELRPEGGMVFAGRSDATLNPGGVRIGTAEIYRVVEGIAGIEDSVVIGQKWQGDERVILFVKLREGTRLDQDFKRTVADRIRSALTPRHVPAVIAAVPAIPYTMNMKKVEIAVRRVVEGQPVNNTEALANPEALAFFRAIPELA